MIRAVVFDLDDTLFPEREYVLSGLRAVSEWLAANRSAPGFLEIAEKLFHDGARGNIFDRTLGGLGITAKQPLIDEMVRVYREHRPAIKLYDDAVWALDFYGKRKKLGLITDGYLIAQRNKVAALGIASWFEVLVYSDEFGRENWKPSPVPYEKVMDAFALAGESIVFIADNPKKDFVTARKLGWRTVRICRDSGEYSPLVAEPGYDADSRIVSLKELSSLL